MDRLAAPLHPRPTPPLVAAASDGDLNTIRSLLADEGIDIDAVDARGRTAVLAATYADHADVVALLLDAGADVDRRDDQLDSALLRAGSRGLTEIVQLCIRAGADPAITNRFGGTALIPACERGHLETIEVLLAGSAVNVNHVNDLGWTALLEAILLADGGPTHQRVVELLLAHGADPSLPDADGVTPLAHASARGYVEIAVALERAGATA